MVAGAFPFDIYKKNDHLKISISDIDFDDLKIVSMMDDVDR